MSRSGFRLDIDAWLERQRQVDRKRRHEQLNATCPYCNTAVLDELEESAHESGGYGPESSTMFECPHCEREIEFDLRWDTVLSWAMPIVGEHDEP